MLALRWIEENIAKYRESKTPTAESIHAIDYSRRLELFETACKVFAIPMEVRHGKREGNIETYPNFWNLNHLTASGQEVLRIPARKKSFELVKRELEAILEKEVLPASIPEFPTVRRMTL